MAMRALGTTALSLTCRAIWVCAIASTGAYAWLRWGDMALTLASAFNAAIASLY
jgi:hypothetical protein